VNYRGLSELSTGSIGTVHGGDRLPWVKLPDGSDNFLFLRSLDWQIHVYGEATEGIDAICRQWAMPLRIFPWSPVMGQAGFRRSAFYLVRPDGHIGAVDVHGNAPMRGRGKVAAPAI
jgi:hypothetical protein